MVAAVTGRVLCEAHAKESKTSEHRAFSTIWRARWQHCDKDVQRSICFKEKKRLIDKSVKCRANVTSARCATSYQVCSSRYAEEGEKGNHKVWLP